MSEKLKRIISIDISNGESIFLFGARQTGKTTFLMEQFKDAIYFDLLETDLFHRLQKRPSLLRETLKDKEAGTIVIIDEIQQLPILLNEVHWLISRQNIQFILCGSSARKLKRNGTNTLGGRAIPYYLYPLTSNEIPNFDLTQAIHYGLLPSHYLSTNPTKKLSAYIDIYLKEEIKAEALVRNLAGFSRFLTVAAITNGEIVNYNNIATDCGVSANTIKEYFSILEETLIGYLIPSYTSKLKRNVVQAPKFYFFDVGIVNHLLNRQSLLQGTPEYGHAFEHLVIQELFAFLSYTNNRERISYWRTYSGSEVDIILGDARVAIEIKSCEDVQNKHLKGLKAFQKEYPNTRLIIVSLDRFTRDINGIEAIYIHDFFKMLWNNKI